MNDEFEKTVHGVRVLSSFMGTKRTMYVCLCKCGNQFTTHKFSINSGRTRSCGCLAKNNARTHGRAYTPEHHSWKGIKKRCRGDTEATRRDYLERGITVCDRWKDSFENFYEDMGPKPSPAHSIERINNDAGYTPDNCKWATSAEQTMNRRNTLKVAYNGEKMALSKAARLAGIHYECAYARLKRGTNWLTGAAP